MEHIYNFALIHAKLTIDIIALLSLNYGNNNITKLVIYLCNIDVPYVLMSSIEHNNIDIIKYILKKRDLTKIINNIDRYLYICLRCNRKNIAKLLLCYKKRSDNNLAIF